MSPLCIAEQVFVLKRIRSCFELNLRVLETRLVTDQLQTIDPWAGSAFTFLKISAPDKPKLLAHERRVSIFEYDLQSIRNGLLIWLSVGQSCDPEGPQLDQSYLRDTLKDLGRKLF